MEESGDFALALQLQAQFDEEAHSTSAFSVPLKSRAQSSYETTGTGSGTSNSLNSSMSLTDERWEMLDPNPDIRAMFLEFNDRFFWGKLAGVEVRWSPRMTLCAGLCCYEGHGGLCSVRLSQPLLNLRPRKDLVETLLHEMIHAYLFVTANNKDHDGHGPEFCKHMNRINQETGTKISVYHNFHDEVDHYRQHWWRCDGTCRSKPPYFGYVKRAMNRAPHPRDTWWAEHQRTCGGSYTKVKEPEGYGQKKGKKEKGEEEKKPEKMKGAADIRSFWNKGKSGETSHSGVRDSSVTKKGTSSDVLSDKTWSNNINKTASGSGSSSGSSSGFSSGSSSGFGSGSNSGSASSGGSGSRPVGAGGRVVSNGGTGTRVITPTWKPAPSHTVSKPPSEEDFVQVSPSVESFPGSGHTLGASDRDYNTPDVIVRRLPGIGVITNERPVSLSQESPVVKIELNGNDSGSESDNSISLLSPNMKRSLPTIDDSTDPESEAEFEKLLKPKKKVKNFRSLTPETVAPGDGVRIRGFKSVSSRKSISPSADEEWKEARSRDTTPSGIPRKKNRTPRDATPTFYQNKKRSTSPVNNFASDRNKRALVISDTDSDTDNDEKMVLGSGLRNRDKSQKGAASKKPRLENKTTSSRDSKPSVSASGTLFTDFSSPQTTDNGTVCGEGNAMNSSSTLEMWGTTIGATNVIPLSNNIEALDPLQTCPVCQTEVRASQINAHLDLCLS